RATLQVQAQPDFSSRRPLETIKYERGGLGFVLGFVIGEITGDVVGPYRFLEILVGLLRKLPFQRHRSFNNGREIGIAVFCPFPEDLDEVSALGRVEFIKRPQDDKNDENKSPKSVGIHWGKL